MKEQLSRATATGSADDASSGAGHILVFHDPLATGAEQCAVIAQHIKSAEIREVHSLRAYREALSQQDFDVVVLDYDIPGVPSKELLMQLQLRDCEPDVLLVSACDNPQTVRNIAAARKRYIVRDDNWGTEVSYAIRDMLRIRKLEEEMAFVRARLTEANYKLEEKNRRLDEFCATIAHDIRAPLAGLMLKVEYILTSQCPGIEERSRLMLQRSYQSAERLVGLVQAMYEYAKIGLSSGSCERVSCKSLVQELVDDLPIEEERQVSIGVAELPQVWGNRGLLRRIFINLIGNAVKYNDKPEVIINIGCSGIHDKGSGECAELFVEDNGPGIRAEDAEAIFDMFSRGTSQAARPDGLGIGLAVVRRIVEMHHGSISVERSPLGGARFVLSLAVNHSSLP
jgi:signal transduction histidine kinase